MRRALCLCCMLALMLAAGAAQAEKYALMRAEAGYDGVIIDGAAVPLEITVKATDEDIDGVVRVKVYTDDSKYDAIEKPLFVKGGETAVQYMSVRPGAPQDQFEIELVGEDGETIADCSAVGERIEHGYRKTIVGVLGSQELCGSLKVERDDTDYDSTLVPVQLTAASFPNEWEQLCGFNVLTIDDYDGNYLSNWQWSLIERYIKNGGIVLLGAGVGEKTSLDWFEDITGVQAGETHEGTTGIVGAVAEYAGVRYEESTATASEAMTGESGAMQSITVRGLTGGEALVTADDAVVMAAARLGDGFVITCGFSLNDPMFAGMAQEHALWLRVLRTYIAAIDGEWPTMATRNDDILASYTNETVRVPTERNIMPVAVLLAAYAFVALALYVILRRMDRSVWLWAAVPLAAAAFTAFALMMGDRIGINKPLAVSTRLTMIDQEGDKTSEEVVSLAYAGQDRVRLSALNGSELRYGSEGFAAYDDEYYYDRELRNIVRLGDAPYIELEGMATWISRYLRVDSSRIVLPDGVLAANAWFEADGLHVRIENGLDVDVENAVLLTNYGYKKLGNIASGETVSAELIRAGEPRMDKYHNILIGEGEMAACSVSMGNVFSFCVNPERVQGTQISLDDDEDYRRNMEYQRLDFGTRYQAGKQFNCVLVADAPQIPCTRLAVDGEEITRAANRSILVKDIPVDLAGETGAAFIPEGEIEAMNCAVGEDDVPQMKKSERSVTKEHGCFGFTIDRIEPESIARITLAHYHWDLIAEVYNHVTGEWEQMGDGKLTVIDDAYLMGFVNENGEIFVRYTEPSEIVVDESTAFDAPGIIVEGRHNV